MMSKEAMKLALDALGEIEWSNNSQWQSDRAKVAITALRQALANEALDRMAENARELGLDYTGNGTAGREADVKPTGFFFQMPEKIGSYTSDNAEHQKLDLSLCDAKRVQLPVGEVYGWQGTGKGQPMCRFDVSEDEMPVGTALYTSPPAQRTWVGLTDEEVEQVCVPLGAAMLSFTEVARAIEAKLRSNNNA